jgi:hypothetical protein
MKNRSALFILLSGVFLNSCSSVQYTKNEKALIIVPPKKKYTTILNDECKVNAIVLLEDKESIRINAANIFNANVVQLFPGTVSAFGVSNGNGTSNTTVSYEDQTVLRYWECQQINPVFDEFRKFKTSKTKSNSNDNNDSSDDDEKRPVHRVRKR